MSDIKVIADRDEIVAIADAVRSKTGITSEMTLSGIVNGVNSITTQPTIQSLSITENGTYTAPTGVDGYSPITVNVESSSSVEMVSGWSCVGAIYYPKIIHLDANGNPKYNQNGETFSCPKNSFIVMTEFVETEGMGLMVRGGELLDLYILDVPYEENNLAVVKITDDDFFIS